MDAARWDDRYRSSTALWSGAPNPQITTEVGPLDPGRALDCGCGEGADAVWLAETGWEVTAVDFSEVALTRAAGRAAARGEEVAGRITFTQRDLTAWVPPADSYDLVSVQFVHLPATERNVMHRRLGNAVAPGGILLLVGHHPLDLELEIRRPVRENLFDGSEVLEALAVEEPGSPWSVATNEVRSRESTDAEGNAITLHDTVVTLRREMP
jgi:SAM-dependent methyltransferase